MILGNGLWVRAKLKIQFLGNPLILLGKELLNIAGSQGMKHLNIYINMNLYMIISVKQTSATTPATHDWSFVLANAKVFQKKDILNNLFFPEMCLY